MVVGNYDPGSDTTGPSVGNAIQQNSIFSNYGLGIDLVTGSSHVAVFGVTANDPCDADPGPNNFQNFPVITSAAISGGSATVQGSLNSTASATFTIEFFASSTPDPAGNGEGQTYVGSTTVTTDGGCNGGFNVVLPVPTGQSVITATATNLATFDTSEFSAWVVPTSTSLASDNNPSIFGQSVTFTTTVSSGFGTPGGTVTFSDGATVLGTRTLNGAGKATFNTSGLAGGSHSITVTYNGSTNLSTSSSTVLTQTVNPAITSTTVASSTNPSIFGQSVTFTATVSSGAGTPSGTVTFRDGATMVGTDTLDGLGHATFITSELSGGTHSITATYEGSSNFGSSFSSVLTQTVNPASTSTTVVSNPNPTTFGESVIFSATVSSSAGTPSGTVTFMDGATVLGNGTLNGSGQTMFATSTLGAGTHSITAVYNGSANFGTSASTVLTQTVNPANTTTSLSSSQNPSADGQSVTFTATVTTVAPGAGTPTGTITFTDGATVLGTVPVDGTGTAVFVTSSLSNGPHLITATYNSSANFNGSSSSSVSQLVYGYVAGGGSFVIGNGNAAVGTNVTFWGAKWTSLNTLSGGSAPSSFKGFANQTSSNPAACGGTWTTDPGNSSPPPAGVPGYMAVIVTSSASKSGSMISGNTTQVVIVQTNSGYVSNPGHAGTGTVVAILCH